MQMHRDFLREIDENAVQVVWCSNPAKQVPGSWRNALATNHLNVANKMRCCRVWTAFSMGIRSQNH